MSGQFGGRVALITGAGRGQGRSHAVRMAQEGADIIAVDICRNLDTVPYALASEDDLQLTAKLVADTGRRAVTAVADVRDLAALRRAVDDGVRELGRLDFVSANAGIATFAPSVDLAPEAWNEVIGINLTGVWHTAKVAIPHLRASGGGSIVITSSGAGLRAFPNASHYVASKHGVVGLMKSLAQELAAGGIRVNTVHPTQVNTPMIHNDMAYALFCPGRQPPTYEDFAEVSTRLNLMPIPWVEPDDVSAALVFLCSEQARFVTGITLPVDAGSLLV